QRPEGAAGHRRGGQRLRHGASRHVRQGRPGRSGGRRCPHPAGEGADRRRHGGVSGGMSPRAPHPRVFAAGSGAPAPDPAAGTHRSEDELLALAVGGAERAAAREQAEAFVASSTSTSVRVHGGEVESLTQATTAGIGVRVVRDGRQGFAYAGSLDPDAVAEALSDARDNAAYAEPEEWVGLAVPDGVEPPAIDLWRDGLAAMPAERKVDLALELERAVRARDRRVTGVRVAQWGDGSGVGAVATSTGIAVAGRSTFCHLSVQALAEDGGDTKTGYGVSVGREPAEVDLDEAAADAVDRATRLLGAVQPSSGTVTLVLEPRMAASLLGVLAGTLNGEAVLKGRSPFADRVGDQIASPLVTLVDDPTDPQSLGADSHDGEGLATRRIPLV